MNDFGNIKMKFRNEFWLILFREYIIPNLFAVHSYSTYYATGDKGWWDCLPLYRKLSLVRWHDMRW
jgi:hypothetical protein